jgi:hypothetical protein
MENQKTYQKNSVLIPGFLVQFEWNDPFLISKLENKVYFQKFPSYKNDSKYLVKISICHEKWSVFKQVKNKSTELELLIDHTFWLLSYPISLLSAI